MSTPFSSVEPIAVIGVSCRFPGGIETMDDFWQVLASGTDAVSTLPPDRFSLERYVSASNSLDGHSYTEAAGIIPHLKEFDPDFFGISRKETQDMDPQQRFALETTWEALENAHIKPASLRGSATGVYFGASNMDNSLRNPDDPCIASPYSMTGSTLSIIANRVSYIFDLHGPSLVVDTACSSSLAAIHMACEALRSGAIPLAIAGGVNALVVPFPFIGFSRARMLSPDGRCKVFDASGNGYVRSEGVGTVVLKPLRQARKDKNAILGVIAGSGMNSDGRTTGIALPNEKAQTALLRQVYDRFALDKNKLVYVEAHGTGTAAGDPIEASAIGAVLGKAVRHAGPLPVGSVKTNIGHLESASGMAGLLKALLVLRHNAIPPNLHLKTPNPAIDFSDLNITVPQKLTPLRKAGGGELISINSFGFGGANTHVVLQRPPQQRKGKPPAERGAVLPPLLLSAKSGPSLCAMAEKYARRLEQAGPSICYDTAATLAFDRECMAIRTVATGETVQELCAQLRKTAKSDSVSKMRPVREHQSGQTGGVFVFSGNGSQWQGMGTGLLAVNTDFRHAIEEVDALLAPFQDWSVATVLQNPETHPDAYERVEKSQPLLFAVQVGLVRALAGKGITPSAVIGHSVGEVAAAWAAGALSLADACRVIHFRSKLQAVLRDKGVMAVVNMAEDKARLLLERCNDAVTITAENTPASLTVAGEEKAVRSFIEQCKQQHITAKMLNIPYPFHTRAMEPIRAELLDALQGIRSEKTRIPFYSTLTGDVFRGRFDNEYWYGNIRQPVLFAKGIRAAFEKGFHLFLEIGPKPVLRSYIRDIFRHDPGDAFVAPTLLQGKNEAADFESAWKGAWQHGWPLDAKVFFPHAYVRRDLPAYPWNREFLWSENTPECRGFLRQHRVHPLLGWVLPGNISAFENTLLPADFPWLADHVAGRGIVYPAAAFLEGMLAAARQIHPEAQLELERVSIFKPLPLSDSAPKVVRITVDKEDGGLIVEARSYMSAEAWGTYARARIVKDGATPAEPETLFGPAETFGVSVEKKTLYNTAKRFLLHYGPAFQTVERAWVRPDPRTPEVLTEFCDPVPQSAKDMLIPPPLLDGALQSLFMLLQTHVKRANHAYLPVAFDRVVLFAPGKPRYAHARLERVSPRSVVASFRLFDGTGRLLLHLDHCRFRRAAWLEHENVSSRPYTVELAPAPHPTDIPPLTGATPQTLMAKAEQALPGNSSAKGPDTSSSAHPYLLLQFAALSAAHESVLSLCANTSSGMSIACAELVESGVLDASQEPWLNHLLERLEHAALAARSGDRWLLQPRGERLSAKSLWRTILSRASGYLPEATLLAHIFHRQEKILAGEYAANELDILPTRLLENYFANSPVLQPFVTAARSAVKTLLGYAKTGQTVNILQIAKTPTAILPDMLPLLNERACRYVVAEKDAAAAEALGLQYSACPALEFAALNPESPPAGHKGRYHLILLAWTLHDHLNSAQALAGCRDMLAPGGILCLLEHTPSVFADYVMGARPSWWAASASTSAPVSLLRDESEWREALVKAGFYDVLAARKNEGDFHPASFFLAKRSLTDEPVVETSDATASPTPAEAAEGEKQTVRWLVVSGGKDTQSEQLGRALHQELHARGESVSTLLPGDNAGGAPFTPGDAASWQNAFAGRMQGLRKGRLHVVYLAAYDTREDLGVDELAAVQSDGTTGLLALAKAWDAMRPKMRLFIVSGGALTDGMPDARPVPSQGAIAGFSRVLMNEMRSLETRLVDVHGDLSAGLSAVPLIARELTVPDGEQEVALCQGLRFAPRMTELTPKADREEGSFGATLHFDMPGRLQNLYWKTMPLPVPQPDEVRIEVKHTGLNFRDVMWSMGMLLDEALENGFSGPGMGIECSGVISAVGSDVKEWKPGDAVVCFTPDGFSSHVVTKAATVTAKPSHISFAEAATIPVAFFTAWYSLKHLARLQPGERVLVHGAAGGVGLAAIQIAAHLGLEVYATAGAQEKHSVLRQLGVKHIFSSRSLAFARQVMDATNGQGVDAVLNALAGEAIPAGLSVLRPFGRFLELGKRDFYADTPMRLHPFSNNLSYYGVDVDQLLMHQPALAGRLFNELMQLFEQRKLFPLPHTVYPVSKTVEAFQAMQQSAHMGKLVVSMDGATAIAVTPPAALRKVELPSDAAYLISGGTGGLGLASAARLARRGAKNLLLLSRGGVKDEVSEQIIADMRANGVRVVVAKTDVADARKLKSCLKQHLKDLPPLRGVIHAAAVLDDGLITGLTPERIAGSLAAKSLGAWNLHQLTLDSPLDFFVLYSSAATPFGNPGQAGYVAANCMLETLGAYRKARKLPAEVIGWGAIDDTGMITRNPKAREMLLKVLGISPTHSGDALYWLEHAIAEGVSCSYFFGLDWHSRADLPALAKPRFSRLRPRRSASQASEGPGLEQIRALAPKEGTACIAAMLIDEISHVLRLPKDRLTPDTPLVAQGMDSLMAVELALAIEQKFELTGYSLPLSEKLTALSLAESLYAVITGAGGPGGEEAEQQTLQTLEQKHGFRLSDASRDAVLKHMTEDSHGA